MSDTPKEIRRRGRFGLWALLSLALLVAVVAAGVVAVTGRPIVAPEWAVSEVETRVNDRLAGAASLRLGGAELLIDDHFVPRVRLTDLRVLDAHGDQVAYLPELRVTFSLPALLDGKLSPSELTVSGASLALHRDANGGLNLALGRDIGEAPSEVHSIGDVLQAIDKVLAAPVLAGLTRIRADALTLTLDDARAGRVWQVGDGRLTLVQDDRDVSIELGFGLANGNGDPATAVMTFVSRKGSPEARIAVRVDNVAAPDIAAQAPALTFLKVVDAPISGDFRASVGADGQIGALEGRLDFGAGKVQPRASITPIRFDKGTLAFTYDPALRKVTFTEASVQSPVLRVKATGQAYLRDMETGLPRTLLAQVKFTQVMVDPAQLFVKPVRFSEGAVDLQLRLDPFDLRLGQLMLMQGDRRIEAKGDFTATDKGWQVSLDTALNEISHTDLLALWPVDLVPQTRDWLSENVQTGLLFNVTGGLRLSPGQEPRLSMGYEFTDADVRFIKTLPPIQQGRGYATIADKTYTMVVDAGHVAAPEGGDIDVAGSVFEVPDITVKPPPAEVKLKTDSTITAALSLLDQPPFGFMTKAGLPVDLADGHARLDVDIKLPLADKILMPDVTFDASGTLTGVSSDKLVKNRVLTADSLALQVNNDRIAISGSGKVGRVPATVTWTQDLGPGSGDKSHVDGTIELSQAFVDEFNIGLPPGAVTGTGTGTIALDLERGGAGRFTLTSDLAHVGLAIPELGWAKPAAATGKLEVAGTLGEPPTIDRLVVEGNGLSATGKVILNPNGSLNVARFDRVKVGGWLDGAVDLTGHGKGISVAMRSGSIDLRHATFKRTAARGPAVPITLSLDHLTVSQGIALTGFHGDFTTLGGFNGVFTAQVNGTAKVNGTVVPSADGTAVRLRADDAGAVMGGAGVFDRGRGGSFDLTLTPRAEAGQYDGRLTITDIKVVKAPALADLLSAISIIGMLDQLNGPGILFTDVKSDFRLTPDAIEVTKGSAVGPSLGISAAGLYDLDTDVFDMQGVISPIYLLNGIGSVLTRAGEGLFGFNYKLKGTPGAPRVSVNPLSILTPGMFRDLFRSAPPTLDK
ncbi:MAG: hypothetical protein GC186_02655 [Rhodobacteraceae bacterium]|nr:hypothetical protein [Paracoccaceae bacterium]